MLKQLVSLAVFLGLVSADLYMHNPRGANNRLNGNNQNRDNANRLCDTQNNNKGGYCWAPPMGYYEGSELSIEWTNQHACGKDSNTHCEIVIQYMCSDLSTDPESTHIRDGTTTDTIPNNEQTYNEKNAVGDFVYGMHESYDYYMACATRNRNQGLFIADRTINGNSARFTRQNNNGGRSGFECAEERDYYPYWHPQPWKDIAVLTSDTDRCSYYRQYSQNNGKQTFGWCAEKETGAPVAPNYEAECNENGHEWKTWMGWNANEPYKSMPNVDCKQAPWSRDNHLGNGKERDDVAGFDLTGHNNVYNWTIPTYEPCIDNEACACVLRLRYNISTDDTDNWTDKGMLGDAEFHNNEYNGENSPIQNDPYLLVAGEEMTEYLAMEINTNQYGRVFQDRSHVFMIRKRPAGLGLGKIYNLNVRGKRGNIVQAYPAVEYDYVPSVLNVRAGELVHFQWTGCDTNAANQAGQGRDRTDRSNLVQTMGANYNMPIMEESFKNGDATPLFGSLETRNWFAHLGQENCLDLDTILAERANDADAAEENILNCAELNAAEQYFDGGLHRMNRTGLYHFLSTRNNNFTNRSHKGAIHVLTAISPLAIVLISVGGLIALFGASGAAAVVYARSNPHSGVANMLPNSLKA